MRSLGVHHCIGRMMGGDGGVTRREGGVTAVADRYEEKKTANSPNANQYLIKPNGIFSGLGHAPLLAKISLVVILGLTAVYFINGFWRRDRRIFLG